MAKAEYRSAVRSRRLIHTALADLLLEKPLDKITVTDVVNRAEINRGTFYAHYADIPDVINSLIQQTFDKIRDAISQQEGPLTQMPGVLLKRIQEMLEEDLDFYKKIMNSGAASVLYEQLVNIVLEYLLQQDTDDSVNDHEMYILTIRFCAGGLSNLYRDWFAGKLTLSLDELTNKAQTLIGMTLAGMA